jgi:hypothetical protein
MSNEKPVPEVVLFTDGRGSRPALVLSARFGEVSHLGKQGEPLLTLAVKALPAPNADHKKPNALQAATSTPEVEYFHDVVHASHEFSDQFFLDKKMPKTIANIHTHRGHGEWSGFPTAAPAEEAAVEETQAANDSAPSGSVQ